MAELCSCRGPLRRRVLAGWLVAGLWLGSAWAQAPGLAKESAVKAAFLSKFGGFVEWPALSQAGSQSPLLIGVIGNDAVAADLEQIIRAQPTGTSAVALKRLREGDSLVGLHILFIGAGREARLRDLLAAVQGPVLVVTEQEDAMRLGSMLNFVVDGGRVRFAASVPAAEARGLRLSARLLAVAHAVEGRER